MFVYGKIVSSRGFFSPADDVVSSEFVKDLQNYQDIEVINVFLNSPGGEVFAAAAIKNQLLAHRAQVNTYGDGIIASATTVIMQGGDTRYMSRAALFMVHNPGTRIEGNASDFQKGIEVLGKVKKTIISSYSRTGLSEDELSSMMDAETYLDADEALAKGFIDKITEDADADIVVDSSNEDSFVFNGVPYTFSNYVHPEELKAKLQERNPHTANLTKGANATMNFKEIVDSLPAEQQTAITNHLNGLVENAVTEAKTGWDEEKATLTTDLVTAKQQVTDLTTANASLTGASSVNPEDAIIAALPEDAKAIVLQAKADAKAAQDTLAAKQLTDARNAFDATLNAYGNLPIDTTHKDALFTLFNTNKEQYTALESLLKVANVAVGSGMVSLGTSQGLPAATDASSEIANRITTMRAADAALTYNEAMSAVIKADPELYNKYREEGFN
jgi:ATP-dependent protease ClpP protease subunit